MDENVERSQQEILNDNEPIIERSDLTAMGVAVPEMLITEEDEALDDAPLSQHKKNNVPQFYSKAANRIGQENGDDEDALGHTYAKSGSLVEFMEIESQIKQATMRSGIGERVFVGDSFNEQVDELGDSIGT